MQKYGLFRMIDQIVKANILRYGLSQSHGRLIVRIDIGLRCAQPILPGLWVIEIGLRDRCRMSGRQSGVRFQGGKFAVRQLTNSSLPLGGGVNYQASMTLAQTIPQNVRFYDLIYHPEETVFLRHGRLSGHLTKNGKAMIVYQAAIALCRHIGKQHLIESGKDDAGTYRAVCQVMAANW